MLCIVFAVRTAFTIIRVIPHPQGAGLEFIYKFSGEEVENLKIITLFCFIIIIIIAGRGRGEQPEEEVGNASTNRGEQDSLLR